MYLSSENRVLAMEKDAAVLLLSLLLASSSCFCQVNSSSPQLVEEFSFYEHAIRKTSGVKVQTEFTLVGNQGFPGYATTYNNKFTKTPDYLSLEVGRAIGTLAWPTATRNYVSAVYSFPEGSITVSGFVEGLLLNFTLLVSSGSGKYFGTFGLIEGTVVQVSDDFSNFVVLEKVKLYKY